MFMNFIFVFSLHQNPVFVNRSESDPSLTKVQTRSRPGPGSSLGLQIYKYSNIDLDLCPTWVKESGNISDIPTLRTDVWLQQEVCETTTTTAARNLCGLALITAWKMRFFFFL